MDNQRKKIRHFLVDPHDVTEDTLSIKGRELHHMRDVLHVRDHTMIEVTDGFGHMYQCRVESCAEEEALCKIIKTYDVHDTDRFELTLLVAILKEKAMSLVLQKCVELGVKHIVPVFSQRSVVKLKESDVDKKMLRWSHIMEDALKQSGQVRLPELKRPCHLKDLMHEDHLNIQKIILTPYADQSWSILEPSSLCVAIGPEGGWTEDEEALFEQESYVKTHCGSSVLRADTAALFVASQVKGWNLS